MLTIRLARIGKKNKPLYRLVISEKKKDLYGDSLEILGSYNPHAKELQVDNDKIKYWLSKGAQMSPTVNNLLIEKKIIDGKKVKASKSKKAKKAEAESKPAETEAKPAEAKPDEVKTAPAAKEAAPEATATPETPAPAAKA